MGPGLTDEVTGFAEQPEGSAQVVSSVVSRPSVRTRILGRDGSEPPRPDLPPPQHLMLGPNHAMACS